MSEILVEQSVNRNRIDVGLSGDKQYVDITIFNRYDMDKRILLDRETAYKLIEQLQKAVNSIK